jgi:hypothetical protein
MRAARHDEVVTSPHMDQLVNLVNESADDPFLLVDRFDTTAFGWRPDFSHDRRETGEEYRDLMLSGLSSEKGKRLVLRRIEDAVGREDARLARFINLLHRHSLKENTLVVLAGIPGDISKPEMEALNGIGGVKEDTAPLFPLTFRYPAGVAPRKDTDKRSLP